MDNALDLLKKFCTYDFVERDCEKALSVLADDISWFGTSDQEDVRGIASAREYIIAEHQAISTPYRITVHSGSNTRLGADSDVAFLRMSLENEGVVSSARVTAASRVDNGVPKLCSMHFSVADSEQTAEEFFPLIKGKEKIDRERTELALSTIAGGLIGYYMKPGLPLYFINDHMRKYLGYEDEESFRKDTNGEAINIAHPDDREALLGAIRRQIDMSGRYIVEYRMRKRDGTYIWVRGIGRRTEDENGEAVIITVCYDISSEHDRRMQMENMLNAMPGGVAMYIMEGSDFRLLYQSRGVGLLTGRTSDEYEDLVRECTSRWQKTERWLSIYSGNRRAGSIRPSSWIYGCR